MAEHMDERMGPPAHQWADEELPPELRDLALHLAAQPVPRPTAQDTALLIERLLAVENAVTPAEADEAWSPTALLRVARWRVRLLGPWFWMASVALVALGAAWSLVNPVPGYALPLILMVPLTGVLSLTYALRTTSRGLREVEAASPVGLVEVAAGLAATILGFDVVFGILATLLLALLHWAPFAALVVAWLGPLLLLTGVSLPLALRWGTSLAAAVGAGPWLALALAALIWPQGFPAQLFAPPAGPLSLALHVAAALVGGCLLVLLLLRGAAWQRFLLAISAPIPL